MSQFVILDNGIRVKPASQPERAEFGATAIFLFSPDFTEIVTLYGSRFGNRKVPSGGIEEKDFAFGDKRICGAAKRGAIRELYEETGIPEDRLAAVVQASNEDTIRGSMKRYYFVAIANERFEISPFRTKEEGKNHYVEGQRWEKIANVLRGASHDGEKYNTLYSIALLRILQEMHETAEFKESSEFQDLLVDLACSGITLDQQLATLEERKIREEAERSQHRWQG